jgi:hypothetical protein
MNSCVSPRVPTGFVSGLHLWETPEVTTAAKAMCRSQMSFLTHGICKKPTGELPHFRGLGVVRTCCYSPI